MPNVKSLLVVIVKPLRSVSDNLNLVCKSLFLSVCLFMAFGGHYPPAHAQLTQTVQIPVITNEDVRQDTNITMLNEHINATDVRVQRDADILQNAALDIAGMKGEERIFGSVLGLLSSVSIGLQIKRKSA
jgi:hypothetical protein